MALALHRTFEEGTVGAEVPVTDGIDHVVSATYSATAKHGSRGVLLPAISPSPTMRFLAPNGGVNYAVSVYVYIDSQVSGSSAPISLSTSPLGAVSARVRFHPDGRIDISNGPLRQSVMEVGYWQVGEWHRLDVNVLHSAGTTTVNVKAYRPSEISVPIGELTYSYESADPDAYVHIGTANANWSLVVDSVRFYDAQTDITAIAPEEPPPPETEYVDGVAIHDYEEGTHGDPIPSSVAFPVPVKGVVGTSNPAPTYSSTNPISGTMSALIPATSPGPYLEYNVPNTTAFSVTATVRIDVPGAANAANFLVLEEVGGLELIRIRLHQSGVFDIADRSNLRVLNSGISWPDVFRIDARYEIIGQEVTLTVRVYDLTGPEVSLGEFGTTLSISDFGDPPALGVPARIRIGTSNANWGITVDEFRRYQAPTWTGAEPEGDVRYHWLGAALHDRFMVRSRIAISRQVGIRYSTSASMASPVTVPMKNVDSAGYVTFDVTGLSPNTTYYYQTYDASGPIGPIGRARTLLAPGAQGTVRVALGACTLRNHMDGAAHTAIRAWNPDFMVHTGDFYYTSSQSANPADYVSLYEDMIQTYPGHSELTRDVPMWYCTSDHEAGPDNGDSNNAWTQANMDAYMQIVPNRVADTRIPIRGRYQSWVAGRIRFIMTDVRNTERSAGLEFDGASKTMLGETQKAWLKAQLSMPEPLKIIITDPGWMGPPSLTQGEDKWWAYAVERQEIINYIAANGIQVEVWHGDSHSLGVKGKTNPYGGFPVLCSAPLAQTGGGRNLGQFDATWSNPGAPTRTWMRITITDDGETITRLAEGIDATTDTVRVSSTETYSATGGGIDPGVRVWNGTSIVDSVEVGMWDGEQLLPASNVYVWNGTRLANINETP